MPVPVPGAFGELPSLELCPFSVVTNERRAAEVRTRTTSQASETRGEQAFQFWRQSHALHIEKTGEACFRVLVQ